MNNYAESQRKAAEFNAHTTQDEIRELRQDMVIMAESIGHLMAWHHGIRIALPETHTTDFDQRVQRAMRRLTDIIVKYTFPPPAEPVEGVDARD